MASRMERYHKTQERSTRNESLYQSIQNLDNYSNIEGVVAIDTTNEIDITKVKAMLQNRENYQQEKKYRQLVTDEEEQERKEEVTTTSNRNYDIRDVLDKAKESHVDSQSSHRVLKDVHYDILEKLNLKATPEEEVALKELIDTIAIRNSKEEGEVEEQEDNQEEDLFGDLKSDTMVGDASSIKKIIDEAKEEEERQNTEIALDNADNLSNIDKSFYTSSLGFTDSDFEDLKNLGNDVKRNKVLIRILIITLAIALIAGFIFGLYVIIK